MKKLLLSLFVGFVGIISFCSSFEVSSTNSRRFLISASSSISTGLTFGSNEIGCFMFYVSTNVSCSISGLTLNQDYLNKILCFSNQYVPISCTNNATATRYLSYNVLNTNSYNINTCPSTCSSCPTCPSCPTCTGYNFSVFDNGNRIVNSSINTDINLYMQGSLLFTDLVSPDGDYVIESSCGTGNDCPVNTGDIQWSSLYINDIQHESSSNINITIPEEIAWDYNRTDEDFDLNVSGYNVDTEYIAGIIQTQNSKPSQGDLNKLVSEVLPLFIPGLAIILLIYFIFRFIKKVF